MHWVRKMKHYARESLLAVVCLVGPGLALAVDTYNSVTDQLTIAELHYGNWTFTNMVVTPGKVISVAGGAAQATEDCYCSLTIGQPLELFAPTVVVNGAATYNNVTATIASMASVATVTGGDSYDGTYLYIPSVLVGNSFYSYVVITVSGVDGIANGFPLRGSDTYISSSNQLTIPALAYGGKAYTNITAAVGRVVSVNGSANTGGPNSSVCYDQTYYATGTTMDLLYTGYEQKSVVLAPSTFNGVANAVGIQNTTITSQGTSVATAYYDITSQYPILLELGQAAGTQIQAFNPGIEFSGAITYGQALQSAGTFVYPGGSSSYTTDYVFEGFEDFTVPAGTFKDACKWNLKENLGTGPTSVTIHTSHQGIHLEGLQPGSTFNGSPLTQ
jgi:hypothetical protein